MSERTIAAVSTPSGEGALGVIRISGDNAIEIADKIFFPFSGKSLSSLEGYQALYGAVKDGDTTLDDGVALVFKAPHSFTGEDTVEISLHGGSLILKSVLRLILKNGAFMAAAGEFTKRAFLNGKLDLTKAESIMGLISAKSNAELRLSRSAHAGKISEKIESIEADLVSLDASISAFSDYPDEVIEGLNIENFEKLLKNARLTLEKMLSDFDKGKILREGIDTAIVGKPNVGKSTLMNMLSGTERSIVTEVAGTTRDVVEETVVIGDITLALADTAGIHSTEDMVESIGVERARARIDAAQLILAVFDSTKALDNDDKALISLLDSKNTIIIIYKTDIGNVLSKSQFGGFTVIELSAKNKTGLEELEKAICQITGTANLSQDSVILIIVRQRDCAQRALSAVEEALNAIELGLTVDAVGVCVDDAIASLFEITGKRVTNEVTDEIFKKFCVGK